MKKNYFYIIVILFIALLFFPFDSCNIKISCNNVSHIIVFKLDDLPSEDGERRTLYTINVYLQQKKINLKKEILQCGDEYATLWAGDTAIRRHEVRAIPKRETRLTPDSFSFGWDSLQLVRETEDEAFALARAICAEKTDPELR